MVGVALVTFPDPSGNVATLSKVKGEGSKPCGARGKDRLGGAGRTLYLSSLCSFCLAPSTFNQRDDIFYAPRCNSLAEGANWLGVVP